MHNGSRLEEDQRPILAQENGCRNSSREGGIGGETAVVQPDVIGDVRGPSITSKLPWGAIFLDRIGLFRWHTRKSLQLYILVLTFLVYAGYHMSRKPFSVVANVLAPNCSVFEGDDTVHEENRRSLDLLAANGSKDRPGWPPFNGPRCKTLIGAVDYAWLFTYAVFLVFSGLIADRVNLRYFLTVGMFGSGVFVGLLGVAYYGNVHHISYFLVIQIFVGVFESTGWPGVIAVMGNWFGKKRRGLLMGVWNAHTSVGNILGTAIPAIWAVPGSPWGWSFLVPGLTMIVLSLVVYCFLITDPTHMGLTPPKHHLEDEDIVDRTEDSPVTRGNSRTRYDSISNGVDGNTATKGGITTVTQGRSTSGKMDLNDSDRDEQDDEGVALVGRGSEYEEGVALVASDNKDEEEEKRNGVRSNRYIRKENSGSNLWSTTQQRSQSQPPEQTQEKKKAISFIGALRIPGVIEFSLALFFAKLVAYTFLFWLPYYIAFHPINGNDVGELHADLLATLYDVGGIFGGITTGAVSDLLNSRAISCVLMMYLAVPTALGGFPLGFGMCLGDQPCLKLCLQLFLYRYLGHDFLAMTVILIMLCGFFINGPYAVITTAVSNDLGTHKDLKDNTKAKATVGAIIDGMGSLGAAFGPLITGWVSDDFGWNSAFYVLMVSCFLSSLMLSRLVITEVIFLYRKLKRWHERRRNTFYGSGRHSRRGLSESKF